MSEAKSYVVTGKLASGRRFKPIRTTNYMHAMMTNLFRGSVWEVSPEGKRKLLRRVYN